MIATDLRVRSVPIGEFAASNPVTADLRVSALQLLEADPIFRGRLTLRAIQVEVEGDRLVLSGCLPSYYLKQQLQEVVRRVAGVRGIENRVEVATR